MKELGSLLDSLTGELVWGVRRSHGSSFSWECGKPHLRTLGRAKTAILSKVIGGPALRRLVSITGEIHFLCEAYEWVILLSRKGNLSRGR